MTFLKYATMALFATGALAQVQVPGETVLPESRPATAATPAAPATAASGEAAPSDAASGDAVVAAQHEGLRALKATMEKALNERDLDTLLANVNENVVFTTMNGDVAKGREAIRAYFEKMMNGPDKVVESVTTSFVPDALSDIYGEDVAVSYGHTNDHYVLKGGKELDIHARWTATIVRKDSRWLVAAFHYSENIFDNPVMNAQRTMLLGGGGVAAVVLGLLGFFFGRRSARAA